MGTVNRKCEDKEWSTYHPQHFDHRKEPMIRNTERTTLKDHRDQKTLHKNLVCKKQTCSAQDDFYQGTEMED